MTFIATKLFHKAGEGSGGGGGGSSYTAGTGIDITGGVISVKAPTLQNTAAASYSLSLLGSPATGARSINIGQNSSTGFSADSVAIGYNSSASSGVAIGSGAKATGMFSIQIGSATNTDTKTVKIYNGNNNYEIMSADGTIPTARLTKVNTTVTLTAAGWSSNTQTVSVTGMTATGIVFVSPDPTDQSAYTSAGIICSAQAANSLTFTCSTTPSADLSVNVVML